MTFDECSENFSKLLPAFRKFVKNDLNEAETRLYVINEILFECLGWEKEKVSVETHVHDGYLDYKLGHLGKRFLIEAKKAGRSFELPITFKFEKNLTVKNLLKKQKDLAEIYEQASRYAHESATPFCVLTNGIDWIAFPGVRTDDVAIRDSRVILFAGLDAIEENFVEFWGLFSQESVGNDSLLQKLIPDIGGIQQSFVFNNESTMNIPYDRNTLSPILSQLLPPYFGDLLLEEDVKLLEECYVSETNSENLLDLKLSKDSVVSSSIQAMSHSKQFSEIREISLQLHTNINNFLINPKNEYYFQILLGRVGIGKSTFLGHFFKIQYTEFAKRNFVLHLNFHDITENTNIEQFFFSKIWSLVSQHELFIEFSKYENLKRIFQSEIEFMERGPLSKIRIGNPDLYETKISDYLVEKSKDKKGFIERLTTYLRKYYNVRVILIFDNVDQLSQSLQEKVILSAFAYTRNYKAFTIVSMWEETYYIMKTTGKALATTINIRPLEMVRQGILPIINKRLQYVIRIIEDGKDPSLNEEICSNNKLSKYLQLILRSLTIENKNVRAFLEYIALGNIRKSLEIFVGFLCAGSLESPKILKAMEWEDYLVPVHEFIKSVMLGSKRYYSERNSQILNLFSIGDMESPSHFTKTRILQYLYDRRHESGSFGHGYIQIASIIRIFRSIGVSEQDVTESIRSLTSKVLIDNEFHAVKNHDDAFAIRITPAGEYYLTELKNYFIYLDLSWQETPFLDETFFMRINSISKAVELTVRFIRVGIFLDYLREEEDAELTNIKNFTSDASLIKSHVSEMKNHFESEKQRISGKIERKMTPIKCVTGKILPKEN